jgi:uncharacterized membrane protein YcaP (DUF421 family)
VFFDDWSGLLRVLIVGVCAYLSLLVMLRGSGKRTLDKLNAFDFIVTVALGSTLATVLLSSDVALVEGFWSWPCWSPCSSSWHGCRFAPGPWSGS